MAFELIILLSLLAVTLVLVVVIWFFGNAVSKNGPMREMALQKEQGLCDGYIGVPTDVEQFLGKQGTALTVLRPAGKIDIGGTILDAVSVHDFIDAGEAIVVTKYENTQLYVMRVKQ
ncbi:MAG: NfeD family protein [Bacteroidales bacterium]|nr:NfeD family protein [Bacteroidales bacterium]